MDEFDWTTHPEAEALVIASLQRAVAASAALSEFAGRLERDTSTILRDWVDHIEAPFDLAELERAGFRATGLPGGVWRHPGAQLPALVPGRRVSVAVRVDDAGSFAQAVRALGPVEGSPLSELRTVVAFDGDVRLLGVERRSWSAGTRPTTTSGADLAAAAEARDMWMRRDRHLPPEEGIPLAAAIAGRMGAMVGPDLAAAYAMEGERSYWQRRNRAAEIQHARQDRMGMGWGNHDHHTFRSSRPAFSGLMAVFRALGFRARERFYAGEEAGWGAQVLEHAGAGLVVFADVDLEPHERDLDFAGADLLPSERLGTVGLWCALHGESMLSAGMHHLEGQFDFDRLRDDLGQAGVGFMSPFSDMPHLRQCFTEAELWPVDDAVVDALAAAGHIDAARAQAFRASGAPGSHLENLARRGGFKGFNQHNVSKTMRATDPRRYLAEQVT